MGNGLLGTIVFKDDQQPNSLRFEIGRTDVYDHREKGSAMHDRVRLPIGQLLLTPAGMITNTRMRTDLWNAEIRGDITTSCGNDSAPMFHSGRREHNRYPAFHHRRRILGPI